MNTPDTEWEKEVRTFVNELAMQLTPSNDTMNAVRLIRKDLPGFIGYMRTSRDTYWKERVLEATSDVIPPAGEMGDYERGVIEGGCYVKRIVLEALTPITHIRNRT